MTSKARAILKQVETVIIDEIHTMVSSKGGHLMLTLERIEAMREQALPPLQRIGLSATQRPLTEVAQFFRGIQRSMQTEQAPVMSASWMPVSRKMETLGGNAFEEND